MLEPSRTSAPARLLARLRETGPRGTIGKAFRDHVFRASDSVIVEYRRGWRTPVGNTALDDGARMVVLRDGDAIPRLCQWMAHRHGDFERMLAAGKIGVFALRDGMAIGCAWIALSDHHDPQSRELYRVSPGEAYHYCWMVDPAARRSSLGLAILREVMSVLHGLGIDRQFGVVDVDNRASYLIQYRFGYRECGIRVSHYYIFGTRWTRMSRYRGTLGPAPATSAR